MNLFYGITHFKAYENYFFDLAKEKLYVSFASSEQYEDDKGYDRFEKQISDYKTFGKIYLRAALESFHKERTYMKITEFAANMSCLLYLVLILLSGVVRIVNEMLFNNIL